MNESHSGLTSCIRLHFSPVLPLGLNNSLVHFGCEEVAVALKETVSFVQLVPPVNPLDDVINALLIRDVDIRSSFGLDTPCCTLHPVQFLFTSSRPSISARRSRSFASRRTSAIRSTFDSTIVYSCQSPNHPVKPRNLHWRSHYLLIWHVNQTIPASACFQDFCLSDDVIAAPEPFRNSLAIRFVLVRHA